MQVLTINEILSIPPGQPVLVTGGEVTGVGPYQTGTIPESGGEWSLQEIMIQDITNSIPVKIANHPQVNSDMVGKILYFAAHRKTKGGLSGLKMDEAEYNEKGQVRKYRILAMSRSGELMTEEQFFEWSKTAGVTNKPAASAPTAPAPPPAPAKEPAQELAPEAKPKAGPMRVTELRYERVVNTGNYSSERMGITIALEAGTKATDALEAAKSFLAKHMAKEVAPVGAKAIAG